MYNYKIVLQYDGGRYDGWQRLGRDGSSNTIEAKIKDIISRMTGEDFYWHSLRHYFTTHLSKLGLPDNIIQDIIGWESADMVRVYKDLSAEEQISQYFDENGDIRSDAQKSLSDL